MASYKNKLNKNKLSLIKRSSNRKKASPDKSGEAFFMFALKYILVMFGTAYVFMAGHALNLS
jgi:hypothetical protein